MPRLLIITQWFDPEPTPRGLTFARELYRRGFTVEVVTGFPNYPGGKLYPGYSIKVIQREVVEGIHITRVPLYPSHDTSVPKRILNYLTFSTAALLYCLLWARRPEILYVYHPPLTSAAIGVILGILRRIPVVVDVQDIWPDTLLSTGMIESHRIISLISRVCNWVYANVNRIIVLSSGFKRLLIQRGVPGTKIDVIYNWCDETALHNSTSDLPLGLPGSGSFLILFAGTMGKAQALDAVLDAAGIVSKKASNLFFVFVGGGIEVARLKLKAKEKLLLNTVFLPRLSMSEVGSVLRRADALIVHLRKDPLFRITIPSKTQAFMATGKPIIMAVEGDAADLILDANCGILAESENPEAISSAALSLYNMSLEQRQSMGSRGRQYYLKHMSLEKGTRLLSGLLHDLATRAYRTSAVR
jgi:colanic acid biosynthesis glycosyl transferase WcaI